MGSVINAVINIKISMGSDSIDSKECASPEVEIETGQLGVAHRAVSLEVVVKFQSDYSRRLRSFGAQADAPVGSGGFDAKIEAAATIAEQARGLDVHGGAPETEKPLILFKESTA